MQFDMAEISPMGGKVRVRNGGCVCCLFFSFVFFSFCF